jgi:hypothetical protein
MNTWTPLALSDRVQVRISPVGGEPTRNGRSGPAGGGLELEFAFKLNSLPPSLPQTEVLCGITFQGAKSPKGPGKPSMAHTSGGGGGKGSGWAGETHLRLELLMEGASGPGLPGAREDSNLNLRSTGSS